MNTDFATMQLPDAPDAVAPDGSGGRCITAPFAGKRQSATEVYLAPGGREE